MTTLFTDRRDAGRQLAVALGRYARREDLLVLALPRGGVPVGYEVAQVLKCPFDVFVVRKLGLPGHPELAMGAIASGGVRTLNDEVVRASGATAELIESVAHDELLELKRRERIYRAGSAAPSVEGRCVLLVDDGLATGASMRAAVEAVVKLKPAWLVVAVPVAPANTVQEFLELEGVDDVVCPYSPDAFLAVGRWYSDFRQTTDQEIQGLLNKTLPPAAAA